MTGAQENLLRELCRSESRTLVGLAQHLDSKPSAIQKTLDALYRRSLVTVTDSGRWYVTDRGRKKVTA